MRLRGLDRASIRGVASVRASGHLGGRWPRIEASDRASVAASAPTEPHPRLGAASVAASAPTEPHPSLEGCLGGRSSCHRAHRGSEGASLGVEAATEAAPILEWGSVDLWVLSFKLQARVRKPATSTSGCSIDLDLWILSTQGWLRSMDFGSAIANCCLREVPTDVSLSSTRLVVT